MKGDEIKHPKGSPAHGASSGKDCCPEWKPGIDKINGFISLEAIRMDIPDLYDGRPFRYCPWCGAKFSGPEG